MSGHWLCLAIGAIVSAVAMVIGMCLSKVSDGIPHDA